MAMSAAAKQHWTGREGNGTGQRLDGVRECKAPTIGGPLSLSGRARTKGHQHLRSNYRCALENERLVIYDLRSSPPV